MIKYEHDEKTGITTATITGCKDDIVHKLSNHFGLEGMNGRLLKAAEIPDVIIGRAKCHPDDTFDESTGNEIARKRLLNKYHLHCIKACNRVDNLLDDYSVDIMNHIQHIIKTCKKHSS